MRKCSKCGEEKPFEKFKKDKSCPSGRSFVCNVCTYKRDQAALALRRSTVGLNPELLNRKEKMCISCKEIRFTIDFYNCKRTCDGKQNICKSCSRIAVATYKAKDPEKWAQYNRDYWVGFEDEIAAKRKAYYEANKHWLMPMFKANASRRRANLLNATPNWADLSAIRRIYEECQKVSNETGIVHEVDHDIPLISKLVCGLHCEANLKIIPKVVNRKKSNKFQII